MFKISNVQSVIINVQLESISVLEIDNINSSKKCNKIE